MILAVNLEVLSQMLDPAREKRYLHIRAAGIFVMQLELFEIRRLVALCHNEAPIVAEERILATASQPQRDQSPWFLSGTCFPLAVVPKAEPCTRADSARTTEDNPKEVA